MSKILIPFFSASGHTRRLARAIAEGCERYCNVTLLDINEMNERSWGLFEEAEGIIFGSPTFMGGVSGQYKMFLDESSYRGFWVKQKLLDKLAAGFTVATYPSGDKLSTLFQLSIFAAQHGMIWVNNSGLGNKVSNSPNEYDEWGCWLGLTATSISDKSKLISDRDVEAGKQFGARFAKAVLRWASSKSVMNENH